MASAEKIYNVTKFHLRFARFQSKQKPVYALKTVTISINIENVMETVEILYEFDIIRKKNKLFQFLLNRERQSNGSVQFIAGLSICLILSIGMQILLTCKTFLKSRDFTFNFCF